MCRMRLLTPPKDNFLKPDGHYLLAGVASNPGAQTCKLQQDDPCCDMRAGQGSAEAQIGVHIGTWGLLVSTHAAAHVLSKDYAR